MNYQPLSASYPYHDQKFAPGEPGLPLTDVDIPPFPPNSSSPARKRFRRIIWTLTALVILHLFFKFFKLFGCLLPNAPQNNFENLVAVQNHDGISLPSDISVERCLLWTPLDEPWDIRHFYETTSFSVPIVDTPEFFILREDSLVPVAVEINQADELSSSKDVVVKAQLKTEQEVLLDLIEICLLKKEGGGRGFSVAGRYPHGTQLKNTKVELSVSIPKVRSETLRLHDLTVDLDAGIIDIKDLESITFGDILLTMHVGSIRSTSLTSRTITAKTDAGTIAGNYTFSKEGSFMATAGSVEIAPTLLSLDGEKVKLNVSTSAGKISTLISLLVDRESGSTSLGSEDRIFTLAARSSVGPIDVRFDQVSVDASVDVCTQTSAGESSVHMYPYFEGSFDIRSSLPWSRHFIVVDENVKDPSGRGRKRGFSVNFPRGGTASGNVWWGDLEKESGAVSMKTNVGESRLFF